MKLTINEDFHCRTHCLFSFSYYKVTLFEKKYDIKSITLIFMYHLRLLFVQRSYPEIFFKLQETIIYDLLKPNSKIKRFHRQKVWSIFKGFDLKLSVFKNKSTSYPENLIKVYR